jgi:hypothetical protein
MGCAALLLLLSHHNAGTHTQHLLPSQYGNNHYQTQSQRRQKHNSINIRSSSERHQLAAAAASR